MGFIFLYATFAITLISSQTTLRHQHQHYPHHHYTQWIMLCCYVYSSMVCMYVHYTDNSSTRTHLTPLIYGDDNIGVTYEKWHPGNYIRQQQEDKMRRLYTFRVSRSPEL